MNSIEFCHKCGSTNTDEPKPGSLAAELMMRVMGYRLFCCKNCGFSWKQFLPMSIILNLIYLLLAADIGFLLLSYIG